MFWVQEVWTLLNISLLVVVPVTVHYMTYTVRCLTQVFVSCLKVFRSSDRSVSMNIYLLVCNLTENA